MASGRRSHTPKPFGPFGAGPPYANPASPTRSFYAPCLPRKRALLPQLTTDCNLPHSWSSAPRTNPLPTRHTANPLLPLHPTHLLVWKPLLTPPQLRYPISRTPPPPFPPQLPHGHIPNTCSPERGGRTRGPLQSPCAIFIVRYEPDRRKVRIIFLKILPDTEKNS